MTALTAQKEIHEEIHGELLSCTIAEMGAAEATPTVPIDAKVMEKIKSRDPEPNFVVVAIESGISRSKRIWTPEILEKVARQVNEKQPVAYKGHIPIKDNDTAMPDPQTVWLAATTTRVGDKVTLYVKGYNLPKADVRGWLEFDAINSVSIRGDSTMRPTKGGYMVTDFDLESIDWSRKNRSGMQARVVSIASEMEGGNSVEPKDIAALDESELRTHGPLLVAEIERQAKEPLESTIAEMETATAELTPFQETVTTIREKLGLKPEDDPVAAVTDLIDRVEGAARTEIKAFVDAAIEKVAGKNNERGVKLIRRLVGEMETNYDGELNDDLKAKIESDLQAEIDSDEDIKGIVSEMSGDQEEISTGGSNLGGRSRRREGAPSGEGDGVKKHNERITVRRQKVTNF
jgi:hypothetical protein